MPKLRYSYESQDEIPGGYADLFTEQDGKYVLTEVEGVKTQDDFDRFETALRKRLADATDKLDKGRGSSPLSREELRDTVFEAVKAFTGSNGNGGGEGGKGGNGGSGGDGATPEIRDLERRLSALEKENKDLKSERDTALGEATTTKLETQLQRAALSAGVDPRALDMVVRLTRDDFELDSEGKAVVKLDPSVKGVNPNAAAADYYKTIQNDDVFARFWPDSRGSGASGSGGGAGGNLGPDNPFSKAGWNKTKQAVMMRDNPAEAQRLMKAAGVTAGSTRPNR